MSTRGITDDSRLGIGGNKPPATAVILAEKYASLLAAIEPLAELADDLPDEFSTPEHAAAVADIMKDARKALKELDEARDKEGRPHLEAKREIDEWFSAKMLRLKQPKKGGAPGIMDILQGRADTYERKVDARARLEAETARIKAREEAQRQARLADEARHPTTAQVHAEAAGAATVQAQRAAATAVAPSADLTRVRSEGGSVASASNPLTFSVQNYAAVDLGALQPYLKHEWIDQAIRAWIKVNGETGELGGVRVFREVRATFR